MNRVLGNTLAAGIAVITSTAVSPAGVLGQCELIKLTAEADGQLDDEFGTSVAMSGNYAVIGAPFHEGRGAAYVFRRTGAVWSLVQKLTASNATTDDRFGQSVAIDGDYLVVGARDGDAAPDNPDTGTAYIFMLGESGAWTQQGPPLVSETATGGDHFGYSVAISGSAVAVGARRHVEVFNDEGAVFVFRRTGADWALEQKLIASDAFQDDELGTSVAISGDVIIAGAPKSDPSLQSGAGAAYVFRFHGTTSEWTEEKKLVASDIDSFATFGTSVSVDGETALLGAVQALGAVGASGAAYLFQFADGDWTEEWKIFAQDGVNGARFGSAVALSGDTAVVGAPRDFDPATPSETRKGAVYYFKKEGDTWVTLGKLRAGDQRPSSELGFSVATDGYVTLAGAPKDDRGGAGADDFGAVYVHFVNGARDENSSCIPCDDAKDCDDDVACTALDCARDLGICSVNVAPGSCLIDGECRPVGVTRPEHECEECNPAVPHGWSPRPAGTACTDDGLFCTGDESCNGAGDCSSSGSPCGFPLYCDDTFDRCVECLFDAQCNDRNDCTIDACDSLGVCSNTLKPFGTACGDPTDSVCDEPDTCDELGNCLDNNEPTGTPCTDDELPCTDDSCDGGVCTHVPIPDACSIDALCHPGGISNPLNECQICDPSLNATAWSSVGDGTPCTDDGISCSVDACQEGVCAHLPVPGFCLIDGVCHAVGFTNPLNECEACDDLADAFNWTAKADGTSCLEDEGECSPDSVCVSGACVTTPVPNGTPCSSDGNDCTTDDTCHSGDCIGVPVENGTPCPGGGAGDCDTPELCFDGGCTCYTVIYVDDHAPLGGDGTSWPTAFRYLQDALTVAAGDDIRVAAGTYTPDRDEAGNVTPGDQFATFQLKNGVRVFGGYAGLSDLDNPDTRDIDAFETILTGDLLGNDDPAPEVDPWYDPSRDDNTLHIVTGSGTDNTAVLDGFTITAGSAFARWPHSNGGGMFNQEGSPTVSDCTFSGNGAFDGGGMFNTRRSSPLLTKCMFIHNVAEDGGGMYNDYDSSPTVTNCAFTGNSAGNGGGMYNEGSSSPALANCTFSGNSAGEDGGGMCNWSDSRERIRTLTNCTFSGNRAGVLGGAISNHYYSHSVLNNCILWGNTARLAAQGDDRSTTITHSCIQDDDPDDGVAYPGEGNIDADPRFVDYGYWEDNGTPDDPSDDTWVEGDYHLQEDSPCIDTGRNGALPTGLTTDFEGDTRVQHCRVDMGADETPYLGADCNSNGIADACDLAEGTSANCNANDVPDECEPGGLADCNANGTFDLCDIYVGSSSDCNEDAVPDDCNTLPIGTVYVDDSAIAGANDGSSWEDAFLHLHSALQYARCASPAVTDVWVAEGVYMPDPTGLRDRREAAFQLVNGVAIYGGFPSGGGSDSLAVRDPVAYETILSGDIGAPADASDNCYHVLHHRDGLDLDETAVLDGFTITGGNADGSRYYQGGGMHNGDGNDPTLTSCVFRGNSAKRGGGIYNSGGSPTLSNCTFSGNAAIWNGGGMYHCCGGSATAMNCTFIGNSADEGGAVFSSSSSPAVINCTFAGNEAATGRTLAYGSFQSRPSGIRISNCILWNGGDEIWDRDDSPITVSHSCVQDDDPDDSVVYPGEGNIDEDPRFVDYGYWDDNGTPDDSSDDTWVEGDYHLLEDSPCIDTGANAALPTGLTADFEGDPRIHHCRVDMGVDETPYFGFDCNSNGVSDACDIAVATSEDCNANGIPDECEPGYLADCNANGTFDLCDIYAGLSTDCNGNAVLDECEGLPNRLYVDGSATGGTQDGSSWANAYTELYQAISYAAECVAGSVPEIWVAQGPYMPDPSGLTDPREAAFHLVNRTTIYGGFPSGGGDGTFEARDPQIHATILSGDIGVPADSSDNCYHVLYHPKHLHLDESAVLDGVTIAGGNTNGRYDDHRWGGGMYNSRCNPTITNSTFTNNVAGGGMYNYYGNPTLTNNTFRENVGRGMMNYYGSPTLTNNTLSDNVGGGMYNHYGDPALTNNTFRGNSAVFGGGINNYYGNPTLTNNTFDGNAANRSGGGIYTIGSPTLTSNTFNGNSAYSDGGGMYTAGSPTVTNSTFNGNSADRNGGGMYASGNATLTNNTFSGNAADWFGGGMYTYFGHPTVANSTFSGNSSARGGGMYSTGSTPILVNCAFAHNEAISGRAFACDSSRYQRPSTVDLTNCILWNGGDEIWIGDESTITVSHSCIQDEDSNDGVIYPGNGNIDEDPLFVDPDGRDDIAGNQDDDLHLLGGSPCIDAGDNAAVPADVFDLDGDADTDEPIPFDFEGHPRFVDDPSTEDTGHGTAPIVDMGAFEYVGVCGNGVVEIFEDCDDAGFSAVCDADCTLAECGDGLVNELAGEACERNDAEACGGQPCRRNCTCAPPTCGNGVREPGEACDGDDDGLCWGLGCRQDCTCVLPRPRKPIRGDGGTRFR